MSPPSVRRSASLAALLLGVLVFTLPLASAAGSGYNLSFSRGSDSSTNPHVDLVSLSTQDLGGGQLQVVFQVAGSLLLTDSNTIYSVYFGGTGAGSSSASVSFSNNSTSGTELSSANGVTTLPYTTGNGGSSLTFRLAESDVGPSNGFTVNAEASTTSGGPFSFSWIGSSFLPVQAALNAFYWIEIAGLLLVVVVVVVVVLALVLSKKKKTQPPAMYQPYQPAPTYPTSPTGYQQPPSTQYPGGTSPPAYPPASPLPPPPPPPPF